MKTRTFTKTFKTLGPFDLVLKWCRSRDSDAYRRLPFRRRFAWRLRMWADRLDSKSLGQTVNSYTLQGAIPAWVESNDLADAFCAGMAAMQDYLVGLEADRLPQDEMGWKP